MTPQEFIQLQEFSITENRDMTCTFKQDLNRARWILIYGVEKPTLLTWAAEIIEKDYVPAVRTISCHYSYAAGDDNIIKTEELIPIE